MLSNRLIGGSVVGALLLSAVFSFADSIPKPAVSTPAQEGAAQQQPANPDLFAAAKKQQPTPAYQQPTCDKPANDDEANYCTQARMADATEKQTALVYDQNWLMAGEGILLVVTLVFTAIATIAATRAAKVAENAEKDADKMLALAADNVAVSKLSAEASSKSAAAMQQWADAYVASERAKIRAVCNAIRIHDEVTLTTQVNATITRDQPEYIAARFRYENLGRTAAEVSRLSATLTFGPETIEPNYDIDWIPPGFMWPLAAGDESQRWPLRCPITPPQAQQVRAKDLYIWAYGRIVYTTITQTQRETTFCLRYDVVMEDFEIIGDPKYNHRT